MKFDELLQDIHALSQKLVELEQRYDLLSEDMYALYRLGELEQSRDLVRWVGYYELRQDRMRAYTTALRERLLELRRRAAGAPLVLEPHLMTTAGA